MYNIKIHINSKYRILHTPDVHSRITYDSGMLHTKKQKKIYIQIAPHALSIIALHMNIRAYMTLAYS